MSIFKAQKGKLATLHYQNRGHAWAKTFDGDFFYHYASFTLCFDCKVHSDVGFRKIIFENMKIF